MPETGSLRGAFRRPFTEQVAFFRSKLGNLVPTQRWDDMLREAHDTGFMVAGAVEADLLSDLAAALDKAIAEGGTLAEFERDFRDIVRRNGWTGWTGQGTKRGEAWRMRTIYRTNMRTSYAAGRYAQLVAGNFKYWVYFHGGSLEPRIEHLGWNGIALPPDHPFWQTHYPPSDWGCSCYVSGTNTAAGVKRLGGDPDKRLPDDWQQRDPATSAPIGIGRGWDYAPGASVNAMVQAMAEKLRNWDFLIAKAFLRDLPAPQADAISQAHRALPSTADDVRRYAQRVFDPKPDLPELPPIKAMGLVGQKQAERIEDLTGIDARRFDFRIDAAAIRHVIEEHGSDATERPRGQRAVTAADFARLPGLLSKPDAIEGPFRSAIGEVLVSFASRIDGELFTATMLVGRRREALTMKTLYIRTGKK
ncbi:MAG: phage minor head protein [Alteraurantiacibacter sp.]